MQLADLMNGMNAHMTLESANVVITGLTSDSRAVEVGHLFAALPGVTVDGVDYIDDAVARGASAVLLPYGKKVINSQGVAFIESDNPRREFALMAARFYVQQPATTVAITGTNGKTSVATFVRQIWTALGEQAASLGTVGLVSPTRTESGSLTTPDSVALHKTLSELVEEGVDHLALEASSHGLDQYRMDGVRLTAAAFTNLSRDHLDYHGDEAAYFQAKLRLFSELLGLGVAVVNADSAYSEQILSIAKGKTISYGAKGTDIRLNSATAHASGQKISLSVYGEDFLIDLPLLGLFQAENALCALALVVATGGDVKGAVAALETLQGAAGRMQLATKLHNGSAVYVDYAHTPDALETALQALRPHTDNQLSVVFGCGGDRDQGKRPLMGTAAVDNADVVFVTDDNPRSEDASVIRQQILSTATTAIEMDDRFDAICRACAKLKSGDILLVAGKGHEQGQIIGDQVLPFDDVDAVRACVEAIGG